MRMMSQVPLVNRVPTVRSLDTIHIDIASIWRCLLQGTSSDLPRHTNDSSQTEMRYRILTNGHTAAQVFLAPAITVRNDHHYRCALLLPA
jgi:hypothetical protein